MCILGKNSIRWYLKVKKKKVNNSCKFLHFNVSLLNLHTYRNTSISYYRFQMFIDQPVTTLTLTTQVQPNLIFSCKCTIPTYITPLILKISYRCPDSLHYF